MSEKTPTGMEHRANPEWESVPDDEPAPRLADGRFVDPDDGTPVWYTIPTPTPGHEWTAGELRAMRGDAPPPPIVGPLPPFRLDPEPVEVDEPTGEPPATRPRNVTPDGVPHFPRLLPPDPSNPEGRTVCGGDGKPWPCGDAPEPLAVEVQGLPDGRPAQRLVDLDAMARNMGVPVEVLEQTLERTARDHRERHGETLATSVHRAEDEGRRYAQ